MTDNECADSVFDFSNFRVFEIFMKKHQSSRSQGIGFIKFNKAVLMDVISKFIGTISMNLLYIEFMSNMRLICV